MKDSMRRPTKQPDTKKSAMLLPPGFCCFGRRDSDDPVIVEVWL
jgi:hypothetical protein